MRPNRTSFQAWLFLASLAWATGCSSDPRGLDIDGGTPDAGEPDGGEATPTDRGVFAGTLADASEQRDTFDQIDPIELVNSNFLAASPGSERVEAELDDLQPDRVVPLNIRLSDAVSTGRVPWSSFPGGQQSGNFTQHDYTSNWPLPGRALCVAPEERISCCTYILTEGVDGSGNSVTYYSPEDMFADDNSASIALREIYAQVPMYLPYTSADVSLSHAWIYNGDSRKAHGSFDYGKSTDEGEDPAFRVRSIANGRAVAKYWDSWHGNVLVIEHDDVGDIEYRSFYFHLRNGKSNDINMAKTRTVATGDSSNSRDKYLEFADLDDPSDLWWGTNSQAIPVDVGDSVRAQQQVAWSGNTGPGGAGAGLNEDGTPKNTITANNHLHFMVAVRDPTLTGGEWLYVDFYGVYEQQQSGCYDLLANTSYDRLVAPFYPYFHGVDLGVFNYYLYYYGQMGLSPGTFTVQQTGDGAIAAGAFKPGTTSWYVYDYLEADDFQDQFNMLVEDDFRLVERSVTLDTNDVPRHNGVFRPDTIDDWFSFASHTLTEYQDTFNMLTEDGYDLVDFFGYHEGNTDRIASIFVPVSGGFMHEGLLSSQEFEDLTNGNAEDGWLPVDVNVMEMADGTYLSGLYRQTGDGRMVHWGMSSTEYQQWMKFYLSQGWDLEVVQNYADGERYAAIWSL